MDTLMFLIDPSLLKSALTFATPIIFAAFAGLFSERSGIVDIGLEGKLLASAFVSAAVTALTLNPWIGVLAGISISVLLSLLHGYASITLGGNQLISGVAINFLASGLTAFLGNKIFGQGGNTPPLADSERFLAIQLPFIEQIGGIPLIGPYYAKVISGHALWVYVAWIVAFIIAFVIYRTRFGLRLLAVGENPAAVDAAGLSVPRLRYKALIVAGVLVAFGGIYMSNGMQSFFGREMSAGQGFIALAALIFAKWRPWQTFGSGLLFGYLIAISVHAQKNEWLSLLPSQLLGSLPYILTLVALAGFVGRANPPKSIGIPYVKEH